MGRKFEIGQRVWRFDINRREYASAGRFGGGGPIYSKHFEERYVRGIEGRSYLIGYPQRERDGFPYADKVGFQKAESTFVTDAEKDDDIWRHDHRYKIVRLIETCDGATLRRVAATIGYQTE
jgi:hypothetical protein